MRRLDLTDKVFGQLTALSMAPTITTPASGDRTMWNCKCKCGAEMQVKTIYLIRKLKPRTRCKECRYKGIK